MLAYPLPEILDFSRIILTGLLRMPERRLNLIYGTLFAWEASQESQDTIYICNTLQPAHSNFNNVLQATSCLILVLGSR